MKPQIPYFFQKERKPKTFWQKIFNLNQVVRETTSGWRPFVISKNAIRTVMKHHVIEIKKKKNHDSKNNSETINLYERKYWRKYIYIKRLYNNFEKQPVSDSEGTIKE